MPSIQDLEELKSLSREELRALWAVHIKRTPAPSSKYCLVRELAWHAQQRVHGGMDAETRRLLAAAVRQAQPSAGKTAKHRQPRTQLEPGSKLIRVWRGRTHEVLVKGAKTFEYCGETYRSLTTIARTITGTHWSGPRFFGLSHRRKNGNGAAARDPD